jgi:hypothetical protein
MTEPRTVLKANVQDAPRSHCLAVVYSGARRDASRKIRISDWGYAAPSGVDR